MLLLLSQAGPTFATDSDKIIATVNGDVITLGEVELAVEFSLYDIPALVYFRNEIPVVYDVVLHTFHKCKFIFRTLLFSRLSC